MFIFFNGTYLQTCLDHGCVALNQLQYLLRVGGCHGAFSVAERLLLCLYEQGLVISSRWPHCSDPFITVAPDVGSLGGAAEMGGVSRVECRGD
jgi:hypothetical protein